MRWAGDGTANDAAYRSSGGRDDAQRSRVSSLLQDATAIDEEEAQLRAFALQKEHGWRICVRSDIARLTCFVRLRRIMR